MTERRDGDLPNPSASSNYLRSPVSLLVHSLHCHDPPVHDLLDAYSILALRINSLTPSLVLTTDVTPALEIMARFAEPLARRLQFDIRGAFKEPFIATPSMSQSGDIAPLSPGDTVHTAREVSMLSQYALRVVASIFRFPKLFALFPDAAIRRLLDDILAIARSHDLPCMDSDKVPTMATTVFTALQLPPTVLEPYREAFLTWMQELSDCMSARAHSSTVIHHLVSTYPAVFLSGMVEVLPTILSGVASTNMLDRVNATVALSGYALAFLSAGSRVEPFSEHVVREVRRLLARPPPGVAYASRDSDAPTLLSHLIHRSINENTPESKDVGPRWAVTVVCGLICLTGHRVFSGRKACKLAVSTAEQVYNRKHNGREELLACIWRCLVWAFSRIPTDGSGTAIDDPRANAFTIVKQELRFGTGACLIATLLHRQSGYSHGSAGTMGIDVERAVSVLKTMVVKAEDSVYRDGVWVLARMVRGIGSGYLRDEPSATLSWTPDDLVVKDLFSRQIARTDAATATSTIRKVISVRPEIRLLEEAEIQHVWDELRDVWVLCVRRELQSNEFSCFMDELIGTWQALLLVRTHLTQEQGHLTATEEFTDKVVNIVTGFLDWSLQESKLLSPFSTIVAQSRALSLCMQLWTIVCNVFSEAWLLQAANALLACVLQRTFDTSSEHVKAAWSRMCAALISSSSPGLVIRLVTEDEEHRTMELRRELWHLTAMSWAHIKPQPSWEDGVQFLCIPVGCWSLTEQDLAAWEEVLDRILAHVSEPDRSAGTVWDSLLQRVLGCRGTGRETWLIIRLLSRWRVASESASTLLEQIGALLVEWYPDTNKVFDRKKNVDTVLQVMVHIRTLVTECPPARILSLLPPLADGLAVWVGDEKQRVPVQKYNDIIVPLYCDALEALRHIPHTPDTLHTLARFFRSAFNRIAQPATGPHAFHNFWKDIEPSLGDLAGGYPEDLKVALCVCHQAFGMSLPSGMVIETESQVESQVAGRMLLVSPGIVGTPSKRVASPGAGTGTFTRSLQPVNRSTPLSVGSSSPDGHSNTSWLPTANKPNNRRSHVLPDPVSPTPARRSRDTTRSSDYVPSSPTDALRARRFAKGLSTRTAHERPSKTPDRPMKRRKLSQPNSPKGTPGLASVAQSSPLASPSKRARQSHSPSSSSDTYKQSKWVFAGVEVPSSRNSKRRESTAGSSTPLASPSQSRSKEEHILSPEVPSPATASRMRARTPPAAYEDDDYDAWEVPIVVDEDVVPDSQPDEDHDHEDSLIPSFMKAPMDGTQPADDPFDAGDVFHDVDSATEKARGKQSERRSPLRMRTAPASFVHNSDSIDIAEPVSVRRARTESDTRLEELRDMCDALEEDGSQLNVDEMLSMSKYASLIGKIMSEKLSKKLSGGGSSTGSAGGRGGRLK